MHKKICVSKKGTVVVLIFTLALTLLVLSTSLLKTKTLLNSKAAPPNGPKMIIGGNDVKLGEFPFVVRIVSDVGFQKYGCSGTLIAPQWVLTASHCIDKVKRESNISVYIRYLNQVQENLFGMKKYSVSKDGVYKHDEYTNIDYETEDLALLHLQRKVEGILPIQINTHSRYEIEGSKSIILGYGKTLEDNSNNYLLPKLYWAIIPLLTNERVKYWGKVIQSHQYENKLYPRDITAGFPLGGIGVCNGDSGGPLLLWNGLRWVQAGIAVSIEQPCEGEKRPGVFTKLSYKGPSAKSIYDGTYSEFVDYSQWIKDTVGEDLPTDDNLYFKGRKLQRGELGVFNSRVCNKKEWVLRDNNGEIIQDVPAICNANQNFE